MASPLGFILCSTALFFAFSMSTSSSTSTKSTITDIHPMDKTAFCNNKPDEHIGLCMEALSSDPRSANNTDPYVFANMIFTYAINNVSDTVAYISGLRQRIGQGSPMYEKVEKCGTWYVEARKDMEAGQGKFNEKRFDNAAMLMSDAGELPRMCDAQFGSENPLKEVNAVEEELCRLSYETVDMFIEG